MIEIRSVSQSALGTCPGVPRDDPAVRDTQTSPQLWKLQSVNPGSVTHALDLTARFRSGREGVL